MSPLSIIFIFQWKSSIVWIRREICTDEAPFALKLVQKSSSQICGWSLMWEDKKWWLFHCRNCYYDYGLVICPEATVWNSNLLMMDLFLISTQLFNWQDVTCWTGVVWITCGLLWCFYQLFGLSFWRHPFTAVDPLVSKWCNATFLQICSDEETNSFTSIFSGLRVRLHF